MQLKLSSISTTDITLVVVENLNAVENGRLSMLVEMRMVLTTYTVMIKR